MVDISPEANIFSIFKKISYKSWYALGEFVDNSVSSWETWGAKYPIEKRPNRLRVEIDVSSSGPNPYIEIRDNASGIAFSEFERAFKVASIPPDRTGLNEFGMGMKTAGFWFSNKWSVRTSSFGDSTSRTMHFDLTKILKEQTKSIDPAVSPSTPEQHFTTIRLDDLNQIPKGLSVTKIKNHLTGMYREFIRQGHLELIFNGEVLRFEEPQILKAKPAGAENSEEIIWRKNIDFSMPGGKQVKGFVAIRETGNTSLAGFALFRKSRLIEGSYDEPYRPADIFGKGNSYPSQRLFGEFHLDGFEVTHTKDAIQWEEGEQEAFVAKIKSLISSEPMNLLRQVDKYRKGNRVAPEIIQEALTNLREFMSAGLGKSVGAMAPSISDLERTLPENVSSLSNNAISTELRFYAGDNGNWIVKVSGISEPARTDFIQVGAETASIDEDGKAMREVQVQVNLGHQFAAQYIGPNLENSEVLLAFCSYLGVALALGKTIGAKSNHIVEYLNQLLRVSN